MYSTRKRNGFFPYSDNKAIVKPQNAKSSSLIVFDDISCDKQDCMREYFMMGRYNSIDRFNLCQTYARISKQLIYDNANSIIIFQQDDINLRYIYNDHVNTDMTFSNLMFLVETVAWINIASLLLIKTVNFRTVVIDEALKIIYTELFRYGV